MRFLIAVALLWAGTAQAQVGQVAGWPPTQFVGGGGSSSIAIVSGHKANGTTSATLTGTSAGNFITVGIFFCNDGSCLTDGTTVSSVASSAGETCSHATGSANNTPGNGFMTDVWYCKNIVGGSDTITPTFSGTPSFPNVLLQEWSGASTTAPDDGIGNKAASASTTNLSVATNGNTTNSGELIYSIGALNGSSPAAGQTQINNVGGTVIDEYQIAGAAGSYTNNWTQGAAKASTSLAAFK